MNSKQIALRAAIAVLVLGLFGYYAWKTHGPNSRVTTEWRGGVEYKVIDGHAYKVEETYHYTIPADGIDKIKDAYIPRPGYCEYLNEQGTALDGTCMAQQELRSAIEYCTKYPEDCSTTSMSIPGMVLTIQYPRKETAFYAYTE